jgi:hypothetical protein
VQKKGLEFGKHFCENLKAVIDQGKGIFVVISLASFPAVEGGHAVHG